MRCVLLIGVAVLAAPLLGGDLRPEHRGASGFALAARRLGETGRALYITAHPDDENNGLLVRLSLGRGAAAGLLTLTRGEGGQNEIGPELGPALGLLRMEELMAVHRFDRVQQFFTLAYEFGYSFSVEETFEKWGYEPTLRDVVDVLGKFRPDVVFIMSPTGEGGGQHHQASARIALAACEASAKAEQPGRWSVARVFEVPFSRGGASLPEGAIRTQVGDYDPQLGMSHAEYGALARNAHRSQGMNSAPKPGSQWAVLVPREGSIPSGAEGPFDGIDTSLAGLVRIAPRLDPKLVEELRSIDRLARSVQGLVGSGDEESAIRSVAEGVSRIRRFRDRLRATEFQRLGVHIDDEVRDWEECLVRGLNVSIRAHLVDSANSDEFVTQGEKFEVDVEIVNRSKVPVRVAYALGAGSPIPPDMHKELAYNESATERLSDEIYWGLIRPSWTRPKRSRPGHPSDRYEGFVYYGGSGLSPGPRLRGSLIVHGVRVEWVRRLERRVYDPFVARHLSRRLKVVPVVSVGVEPAVLVYSTHASEPIECRVSVQNFFAGKLEAEWFVEIPGGWSIESPPKELSFERPGEEIHLSVKLRPPALRPVGDGKIRFGVRVGDKVYREGFQVVSYHHIEPRLHYRNAEMTARAVDVKLPAGLKVGYIMGVGDEVPAAIEALGAEVKLLSDEEIATADLSKFDTIVTGIRAYKDRTALIRNNRRLLEYVKAGGHWLCQYNKYEFLRDQYAPYPLTIRRPHDRVTDENAAITILEPKSPVFQKPNRIAAKDWEGWVQERGLYFLGSFDERYTPLLEMEDPFPYNPGKKRGALVLAKYGKGTYVYTGIGFFRQLPAGVPGAYRLFANLLSLSKTSE